MYVRFEYSFSVLRTPYIGMYVYGEEKRERRSEERRGKRQREEEKERRGVSWGWIARRWREKNEKCMYGKNGENKDLR